MSTTSSLPPPLPAPAPSPSSKRARNTVLAVAAAFMAAALALLVVHPFSAGAQTVDPVVRSVVAGVNGQGSSPAERLTNRDQMYAQLGQQLGKSADEVKSAVTTVVRQRLDAKVSDGTITQDRANQIFDAWQNGTLRDQVRTSIRDRLAQRFPRLFGG